MKTTQAGIHQSILVVLHVWAHSFVSDPLFIPLSSSLVYCVRTRQLILPSHLQLVCWDYTSFFFIFIFSTKKIRKRQRKETDYSAYKSQYVQTPDYTSLRDLSWREPCYLLPPHFYPRIPEETSELSPFL